MRAFWEWSTGQVGYNDSHEGGSERMRGGGGGRAGGRAGGRETGIWDELTYTLK